MSTSMNATTKTTIPSISFEPVLSQEEIHKLLEEITGTRKATESVANVTETSSTENVIPFPMYTTEQMETETPELKVVPELQVVPWVNERNAELKYQHELMQRNRKANAYIQRNRKGFKKFLGEVVACTVIVAIYFVCFVFL